MVMVMGLFPLPKNWKTKILIRTAKDEKDYHGGANHYTNVNNIRNDVIMLM